MWVSKLMMKCHTDLFSLNKQLKTWTITNAWLFPIRVHTPSGHTSSQSLFYILHKSLSHNSSLAQNSHSFWRDVCTERKKCLEPVSVSLKTSVIQAHLIRSALIAISNDGNNMKRCVCCPHPAPSAIEVLRTVSHVCQGA